MTAAKNVLGGSSPVIIQYQVITNKVWAVDVLVFLNHCSCMSGELDKGERHRGPASPSLGGRRTPISTVEEAVQVRGNTTKCCLIHPSIHPSVSHERLLLFSIVIAAHSVPFNRSLSSCYPSYDCKNGTTLLLVFCPP